jgi:DNA-binding CsgD family transcriptional regulator/tetratricopeptide (TPR) repeat protein
VPDAAELAGLDLAALCSWAAALARLVGDAIRALELTRRAIELVGGADPHRAALLHVDMAEDIYGTGSLDDALAMLARAVELVPAEPPSAERAFALGSLAGGLMLARRHAESIELAEQALAVARDVGAREAEVRALTVLGTELARVGRGGEGVAYLDQALALAEEIGDRLGLERAYVNFTDALMGLGRPGESARLAEAGLEVLHRYGIRSALLVANRIEALLAIGVWDEADRLGAAALRTGSTDHRDWLLAVRAAVEASRGELDAARAHIRAAGATSREDHVFGLYDSYLAELPLWECRWADAAAVVDQGLAHAVPREAAAIRVQLCAKGLRAQAELAALARARRDLDDLADRLARVSTLLSDARRAAREAEATTPEASGWLALAEAEYLRARGEPNPQPWAQAAASWERLERPPLAAYCWWREAEALVASGASRTEASRPLRAAHSVAARIGAKPLRGDIELLAERARLDLAPATPSALEPEPGFAEQLGLTTREMDVLTLLARGYTNREIADELVISVKTASVHVSHILQKLDAPNRREAAAIAHRFAALEPGRR